VGPRAGLDDVEKRKFLILQGLELLPLYRVLTMVYNTQRYWVFGLCPSSGFFLNNNEKHKVSETGSVSVLR
jgi:hypothetical protein